MQQTTIVCAQKILLEVYKIVSKIGPRYLYEMFNFREISYDLRNSHTIIPFNYNTMHHGNKSIRFVGATLWNMMCAVLKQV